jgi:hypothetical protein
MVRRTIQAYDAAIVASCPKCKVNLKLFRSSIPQIDSSGFESYSFQCEACKSSLAGIIDPLDEELLVSLSEPAVDLSTPHSKEWVASYRLCREIRSGDSGELRRLPERLATILQETL